VVSLASDDVDFTKFDNIQKIYVGSHGDNGAHYADVILPAAGYTEKDSLYITSEGRVRYMARAVFPVGDAKEDWAILRALSEIMDKKLPFDSFLQLRQAVFAEFNDLNTADTLIIHEIQKIDVAKNLSSGLYSTHIKEFYMTDPACRASKTLHSCQRAFYGKDSLIDNNKKVA
jgi:NADH-quinone oxidoreductase subunit G